jgi:NTP pyrophosphatase (non-canonical NTP hydrolase)
MMRIQHGAIGAANEAGELLGIIKKAIFYGKGMNRNELRALVRDEAGDVLWYLAILFHDLDLTFEEVMEANTEKLKARYGGGSFDFKCVEGTNGSEEKI